MMSKVAKILRTNEVGDKFSSEEVFEESNLFETSSFWPSKLEHKVLKSKVNE